MPHIKTFSELEDYLQDLNYEHGCDHTAIEASGILYSAFCTDPDGAWVLETGDPRERMEHLDGDDSEPVYMPLELDHLKESDPFNVLYVPGQGARPDLGIAAGRVSGFLRQWKTGSSNDRGLIYTAAMDVNSPRADLLAADREALLEAALASPADPAAVEGDR